MLFKTKTKKLILAATIFMLFLMPASPAFSAISSSTQLNAPIPGASSATSEVSGLAEYLRTIYNFGIAVAGILAMIMITVGGVIYITSSFAGNVVKVASGMEFIKSALIGLAIVLLSYLLIYTLDPKLTRPEDVFLDISETTCNGGMANVKSAEDCVDMCTVSTPSREEGAEPTEVNFESTFTEEGGCCTCGDDTNIECVGDNAHPGVSLSNCAEYCKLNCPKDSSCRIDSFANEKCCKCFVTKFEDTDLKCEGGSRSEDRYKCGDHCFNLGGVSSYDKATQCCMCNE